jgi:4-diphosphocytidyl-2-C-methyl-D-erythritol kinase
MEKTVKAYAKINLHMDVTGIREDGYHSVETVMQSLSLCDDVSVCLTDDGSVFASCNIDGLPTDERNIAVRAARLYLDTLKSDKGAFIRIEKRIPMAAGLAGGSADAAATLIALNSLFENALTEGELLSLGSSLGADVPFCIACGTHYSDGRGDILHDFPRLDESAVFVVACGGEGVSTPWGYQLLDKTFDNFNGYSPVGCEALREAIANGTAFDFSAHLFNIFEAPVIAERPVARRLLEALRANGALAARMSGSGPSVYGVFDSIDSAEKALAAISPIECFACICYPVPARNI